MWSCYVSFVFILNNLLKKCRVGDDFRCHHGRVTLNAKICPWGKHFDFAKILLHDDVIKWKHFPRYWPFVREIHRSPVNFPHKGQWRGALMFTLICARMNGWVNNREAGDLRRYLVHYDVIVMILDQITTRHSPSSTPGPLSLSGRTAYRKISWSLEVARLVVIVTVSLWNLTGISRCLSNFRVIGKV